jgi:hypothetical protein
VEKHVVPLWEERKKTPVYVSDVRNTQIPGLDSKSSRKLVVQISNNLMLVTETTDGFRATMSAQR